MRLPPLLKIAKLAAIIGLVFTLANCATQPEAKRYVKLQTKVITFNRPVPPDFPKSSCVIVSESEYQAVSRKAANTRGTELISLPSITVTPRKAATMEMIREFIYPMEWDKDAPTGLWTPTKFDTAELGYKLEASCKINADGSFDTKTKLTCTWLNGFADLDGDSSKVIKIKYSSFDELFRDHVDLDPKKLILPNQLPHNHRLMPRLSIYKIELKIRLNSGVTMVFPLDPDTQQASSTRPARIAYVTATLIDGTGREVSTDH